MCIKLSQTTKKQLVKKEHSKPIKIKQLQVGNWKLTQIGQLEATKTHVVDEENVPESVPSRAQLSAAPINLLFGIQMPEGCN